MYGKRSVAEYRTGPLERHSHVGLEHLAPLLDQDRGDG
jgi:hypothetical protein